MQLKSAKKAGAITSQSREEARCIFCGEVKI